MGFLVLRMALLMAVFQNFSTADLFQKSDNCVGVNNETLHCPSNMIYYFECCANECCLRTQAVPAVIIGLTAFVMTCFCLAVPAVIIGLTAFVMTCFCLVSCFAYCCCGDS